MKGIFSFSFSRGFLFGFLFLSSISFCSCKDAVKGENPLASVKGHYLYPDDVPGLNAVGLSSEDSASIIEQYVKTWATGILFYDKAQESVENSDEIEELMERYRESLLVYEYQLQLVKNEVDNKIPESEIRGYYEKNEGLFKSGEVLISGFYIVIPNKAPDMEAFRTLSKHPETENFDIIESLCVKNAAKFEYFRDNWLSLSDIQKNVSVTLNPHQMQREKSVYEVKDSVSTFLCYVERYRSVGDVQPFEYAEPRIKAIISERKKNDFLKKFGDDLLEEASKSGELKRY
ncbi:MAG: hypothetical protein WCU80_07840 [Paludibacteraceae bacterium]